MLCPSPLSDLVSLYTFIKFPPFHQNLHEFFIIVRYANLYIMICWFLLLAYHNCRRCLNMSGLHKETCWSSLASSSLANNSSGGFLNLFSSRRSQSMVSNCSRPTNCSCYFRLQFVEFSPQSVDFLDIS